MSGDGGEPHDWPAYYEKTGARPPRETLLFALDRFDTEPATGPRLAVDLGCGSGRDTIELVRRGWRVLAIDAEASAIGKLTARDDLPSGADLTGQVARFEEAFWPTCDLVNSSFALPLMAPDDFTTVWSRITASLKPGGRIACQLFGSRDSWTGRSGMTFHDREAVDGLLEGFNVEMLREEEDDSTTVRGEAKHWHIFHIVARKV
ncbi:MAG: methyltransferase domain-containing protein [Alphaproteobacteria bacterium]|nr:methyltransferase domain-containing protein [Alphaproteobacteria bacterium]